MIVRRVQAPSCSLADKANYPNSLYFKEYMTFSVLDIMKIRDSVYNKNKYTGEIEAWGNIVLAKWLAHDVNILELVRKTIEFQYYIPPKHYYYLMLFSVKKQYPPKITYPKKIKPEDEEKLELRLRSILDWSKSELEKNRYVVNDLLKDSKYWKERWGVK